MAMQKESGFCTGRGFSDTHANGFLSKLYDWIQLSISSGGPGWNILIDKSTYPSSQAIGSINTTTDEITIVGHGFIHGECLRFTTTGSFPTGIAAGGYYYVYVVDDDTFKISESFKEAYEGNSFFDFVDTGSGCSVNLSGPYIVVSNESNPDIIGGINTHIWKIGYFPNIFNYILMQCWLSPGCHSNALPYGIISGYWLNVSDGGANQYDFRGGPDFLLIQCYLSSWWRAGSDNVNRLTTGVENPNTVYGKINIGSDTVYTPGVVSQVITLESASQANSFTKDYYYFIIFFGENISDECRGSIIYGQIDAVGTADGLNDNQIRFNLLSGSNDGYNTIYDGAIISPFYHFVCTLGRSGGPGIYYECINYTGVPNPKLCVGYNSYSGTNTGYVANQNTGQNYGQLIGTHDTDGLRRGQTDNSLYVMERPLLTEWYNANQTPGSTQEQNMSWGEMSNFTFVLSTGITDMTTIITADNEDYISIGLSTYIIDAVDETTMHVMVLDTEST